MTFAPFELERWQSDWEQRVEINLADSGVAPLTVRELLDGGDDAHFLDQPLHYPEVNGTLALRERIAALHPGSTPDNILVTVGAAEANSVIAETLLRPGDRVVVQQPGYQQVYGLAVNRGCSVEALPLLSDDNWRLDRSALERVVTPGTQLVSITNPNNPTGAVLTEAELRAVVEATDAAGAWLHVDEVYRGSELCPSAAQASTAWGSSPRVIVVGSLSKAYALSGLRVGWIVAPRELIAQLWRRHEYAAISTGSVSMYLAERALTEPLRSRLLQRQRDLIQVGLSTIDAWVRLNPDVVSIVRPPATPLAFIRYSAALPSVMVATAIRDRASVLVAPGAYLGAEHHLRVAHALDPPRTSAALERITTVLRSLT
jgi:aspartate/methionine/tyrosine aminotransferase